MGDRLWVTVYGRPFMGDRSWVTGWSYESFGFPMHPVRFYKRHLEILGDFEGFYLEVNQLITTLVFIQPISRVFEPVAVKPIRFHLISYCEFLP